MLEDWLALVAPADVSDVRHDQVLRFVPHKHASRRAAEDGHPIVRSVEPGEDWSWCYVDQVMFQLGAE